MKLFVLIVSPSVLFLFEITIIEAICIESPREVTTKYGQRLVIDAIDRTTGEKITLWRPATDDYSRRYVIKNSPLTVGIDSKGKYSLMGLKQISSPNKAETGFISGKHVMIVEQPLKETERHRCPKSCQGFHKSV
jgi:hypothetical protein